MIAENQLSGFLPLEHLDRMRQRNSKSSVSTYHMSQRPVRGRSLARTGPKGVRDDIRTYVGASFNQMSGTLPPQFGKLRGFDLSFSGKVSGTLPTAWGGSQDLDYVRVTFSRVSGTLSGGVFTSPALRYINLFTSRMSGMLPTELGKLTSLTDLTLDFNFLTGTLPTQLGGLIGLSGGLTLAENHISGTVPPELGMIASRVRSTTVRPCLTIRSPIPA